MMESVEPVHREIVVNADPAKAFEIFTADMTSWWPTAHHIGTSPIAEIIVEPFEGGRWYTRHRDGSETSTGFVRAWDPPARLVVTWQIGADWQYHTDLVTTVEIRFEAEPDGRTRVILEHRDLSAFGAHAESMRDAFDQPNAWTATMAAYLARTGRSQ